MDALQDVRGRDVVHVEGRVLAQQDHVHLRKVGPHRLAQREMVALHVANGHGLDARHDLAVAERQPVGRVVEQLVAAPLRFQRQREAGVARNVDGGDVVHLDGDVERHVSAPRKVRQAVATSMYSQVRPMPIAPAGSALLQPRCHPLTRRQSFAANAGGQPPAPAGRRPPAEAAMNAFSTITDQPASELELTILMPCLNEAETIAVCIGKAKAYLAKAGIAGEVLIADNGSTDGSQEIADSARRAGRAGAAEGLWRRAARAASRPRAAASSSWATPTIPTISARWTPSSRGCAAGADLVMGNRFKGGIAAGAMPPLHRYLGNPVLSFLGRLFFRLEDRRFPLRPARLQRRQPSARSTCAPRAWSSPARWWCARRSAACASRRCRRR